MRAGLARRADGPRPRLRDRPVARGQLPPRDRAGAARPPDLRRAPHQVDAADQAQDRRHLPQPRPRRDVQPRRRHHGAVDRAARHVQRGDPQPAADGPLPRRSRRRATSSTRRAPRRRDRVASRTASSRSAPRRCSTRRTTSSTRSSARRIWDAIARGAFADVKRTRDRRQGLRGRRRERARRLREPDPRRAREEAEV